jgi:hypothetical protein
LTSKVPGPEIRNLSIPAVRRTARVAVISPASYPQPDRLTRGVDALGRFGFVPTVGRQALAKAHHYFAGTTRARLDDLHAAFLDPAVEAIFCSRGGYGCNYLLKGLDLGLVREHPKPLIAYSDMTCMQTWLLDQAGLVSFHGPMVAADFSVPDGVDEDSLQAALCGDRWFVGQGRVFVPCNREWPLEPSTGAVSRSWPHLWALRTHHGRKASSSFWRTAMSSLINWIGYCDR